jgi:hypothetical protein
MNAFKPIITINMYFFLKQLFLLEFWGRSSCVRLDASTTTNDERSKIASIAALRCASLLFRYYYATEFWVFAVLAESFDSNVNLRAAVPRFIQLRTSTS